MTTSIADTFSGGIFAITLLTKDLEKSRDFYQNKIGLTEVFKDDVSSVYQAGTTMINLLSVSEADEPIDSHDKNTVPEFDPQLIAHLQSKSCRWKVGVPFYKLASTNFDFCSITVKPDAKLSGNWRHR